MRNALVSSVCCAGWLLAGAALAEPASQTVSPLTVEGATPKTITTQARAFVVSHATAPNPEIGQISRWHSPVCVQVEGLAQAAQANAIKARIESVAGSVGLPAARAGCKANVEIVFSDDPQATMDLVAQRREDLLGYYHRTERDRLKTVSRPIQAWYKTSTRGEGDRSGALFAGLDFTSADPDHAAANLMTDDPNKGTPTGCADSPRFKSCLTSEFENVFIVVDAKALRNKGAGLAADYLVMLALSQPKALGGCSALPSILDLTTKAACAGRNPPGGLTPADAAWLTALYASDPQAKGANAQSDISSRMATMLIKASSATGGG